MRVMLNYRYYVLLVLLTVAMLGTFSEPVEGHARWMAAYLLSKAVGLASLAACHRLTRKWMDSGELPELETDETGGE